MANTSQSRGFHENTRGQLMWQSHSPIIVVTHDGADGPLAAGLGWRCSPRRIRHLRSFCSRDTESKTDRRIRTTGTFRSQFATITSRGPIERILINCPIAIAGPPHHHLSRLAAHLLCNSFVYGTIHLQAVQDQVLSERLCPVRFGRRTDSPITRHSALALQTSHAKRDAPEVPTD